MSGSDEPTTPTVGDGTPTTPTLVRATSLPVPREPGAPRIWRVRWRRGRPLHVRLLTPEINGLSREYQFKGRDYWIAVMDHEDVKRLMASPDAVDFEVLTGA